MPEQTIDPDTLAQKIAAAFAKLGGSRRQVEDDDEPENGNGKVPFHRLQSEREKRRGIEAAFTDLHAQVQQLQAGYQQAIEQHKQASAGEVKTLAQRHQQDLALVDLGLTDPLGRDVVRRAWESQPQASRPPSPVDYWKGTVEAYKAHVADPKTKQAPEVPRALSAYLPAAPAEQSQQALAWAPPAGPAPKGSADPLAGAASGGDLQGWFAALAQADAKRG